MVQQWKGAWAILRLFAIGDGDKPGQKCALPSPGESCCREQHVRGQTCRQCMSRSGRQALWPDLCPMRIEAIIGMHSERWCLNRQGDCIAQAGQLKKPGRWNTILCCVLRFVMANVIIKASKMVDWFLKLYNWNSNMIEVGKKQEEADTFLKLSFCVSSFLLYAKKKPLKETTNGCPVAQCEWCCL